MVNGNSGDAWVAGTSGLVLERRVAICRESVCGSFSGTAVGAKNSAMRLLKYEAFRPRTLQNCLRHLMCVVVLSDNECLRAFDYQENACGVVIRNRVS